MRTTLVFLAGFAFAVALTWPVRSTRQEETAGHASKKSVQPLVDEATAVVVELESPPGLPSQRAPGSRPSDSRGARRQALARTLRDLARRPPEVEPTGERPVEADAMIGDAMRDALVRALEGGDR